MWRGLIYGTPNRCEIGPSLRTNWGRPANLKLAFVSALAGKVVLIFDDAFCGSGQTLSLLIRVLHRACYSSFAFVIDLLETCNATFSSTWIHSD